MLGLGTSLTSIDSANIYRELSELENYSELVLHYDFSLLAEAHEARITSANNLGQGGGSFDITSVTNAPTVDASTAFSRKSVKFDAADEILNMDSEYTTTNKAFTFFIVFNKADVSNDITVSSASNANSIKLEEDVVTMRLGSSSAFTIDHGSTAGSTVDYEIQASTPTLFLIRRNAGGSVFIYADNFIYIASKGNVAAKEGATFSIQHIGGTEEGTIADFNGNIGELGVYDLDMESHNIEILMKELCKKWGITRTS
mgnify:FL=1